ncbi:MAG: FAD-dependent oxidoreductase [Chloroflexota bacterium]|nr:MAG: FAD-dependent oxidoreductase [Chloroflexota bacterium]
MRKERRQTSDIAVIGAGIMGASAAWALSSRGFHVRVFEQFDTGHARGSSHGASRIFRLIYEEADYVRLAQASLPLWRELERTSGTKLLHTTGSLAFGPPSTLESFERALQTAGAEHQRLSPTEIAKSFPGYALDSGVEALYQRDGGVILADQARTAFLQLARENGATILERTPVTGLRPQDDGSVTLDTGSGSFRAECAVVAPSGWATRLLDPLGLRIAIRVTREQVSYFRLREGHEILPCFFEGYGSPIGAYVVPSAQNGEVKVGAHGTGAEIDPDEDGTVDPVRVEELSRFVADHLPSLEAHPLWSETCLYASTPDDDFVLDRVGGLVIGVGFGGHGFKFAPAIGRMIADLVEGREGASSERFAHSRAVLR